MLDDFFFFFALMIEGIFIIDSNKSIYVNVYSWKLRVKFLSDRDINFVLIYQQLVFLFNFNARDGRY